MSLFLSLWFGIVPVTVAALAIALTLRQRREQLARLHTAAAHAGLTDVEGFNPLVGSPTVQGRAGALEVRLRVQHRDRNFWTAITVQGLGHAEGALTLRPDGLLRRAFGSEIEVGAPDLDDELFIQGDPALAHAVFDADTRRRMVALAQGKVKVAGSAPAQVEIELTDGVLEVRLRDGRSYDGRPLDAVLPAVLDLARRLAAPPDLARRIAENLRDEPGEGVRQRSLQLLADRFPDHPATRKALLAALRDRTDVVRLCAARALGEEGRETLPALAADPATDDACAARAVATLGPRLPPGQAAEALRHALHRKRHETARACLGTLADAGAAEHEELLIKALANDDDRVAIAAARALGRTGTVAAVAPLREAAQGLLAGGRTAAARQAIARIQARQTGAEPGQLSVAADEAGALSLPDGEPGQLTLNDSEDSGDPTWSRPAEAAQREN